MVVKREMVIRRVLGASKQTIMRLVIIDLMKPLLLGAIIGLPLGWIYARDWLMTYSIRIEPALWQLVLVGLIGLVFYLITVATEIRRASRIHPAQALHHE